MKRRREVLGAVSLASLLVPLASRAQIVTFSTSSTGVTKSISQWGVEVVEDNSDNMRLSINNMGANNIDLIATNFFVNEALQANGSIGPNSQSQLNTQLSIAAMAGNKPIFIGPNVGDTDASYLSGSGVSVSQWVKVLDATKSYMSSKGWTVTDVTPFNEPDFWGGQGTQQNLHDIMASLKTDANYQGVGLVGGTALNSDLAQSWYDPISSVTNYGATHVLGGSANSYANFFQHVVASGGIPSAPELHGLGEAIYAAEYGAQQGLWWSSVLRARGLFVQDSQGVQLGYAENRPNDTAAAVYRNPDGSIRAYAGGFERMGTTTPYRFVSSDRDVYFNGIGPMRQYMIQAGQGEDAYADIQTTGNIEPALDGYRWEIVNRQTGAVMQVVGAGTTDGAAINSGTDTGALNQRWNIVRTKDGYYQLFNANSGRTAEVANSSILNGAVVQQFGMANNLTQNWYIQDAGNGYYYIENGNSSKYLTTSTTNSFQFSNLNSNVQQWQFVLANPTSAAKSQYKFDGNVNDNAGANSGVAFGNPTYGNGPTGQDQAINLNGTSNYVTLPSGVASSKDITIAADVKWNGGNAWQRIFDFGNGTTSYMFLTPLSGANTMRFAITTGGNTTEQILDTDPLTAGQWVHLAITLGGNTAVLYVNGKPTVAGQILLNPSDVNPTLNYIGKSQFNDPLFSGSIDDFRIYDYALAQSQIASLVPRRWTGALSSSWTTGTLSNPKNWQVVDNATDYVGGDVVLLDDNATNFTVSVTDATVSPSSVQFDNSLHNYILNGPGAVAGSGALTKTGTGVLTINNANTYSGGTSLNAGTLNINNPSAIGTGPLTIAGGTTINNTSGSAVTLTTNNAQNWNGDFTFNGSNALNVGTGAVTLSADRTITVNGTGPLAVGGPIGGGAFRLIKSGTGTLLLSGNNTYTGVTSVQGGTLVLKGAGAQNPVLSGAGADLKSGKLLLDYTGSSDPVSTVKTILGAAYPSNFTSGQIHSSNTSDLRKGIGYFDNSSSSQLSLMYTYYGDTNLDGQVNIADFNALAANFGTSSGAAWQTGDFNYDGRVNLLDLNAIASNFGASPISLAPPALGTLVPEPGSIGMLGLGLAAMIGRRRQKR
jgi:autotransporter-associated beta strand protein